MSKIIQLPDGQTALFRDPEQVPERLRRPLLAAWKGTMAGVEEWKTAADGTILTDKDGKPVHKTQEEMGREMMAGSASEAFTEGGDRVILALCQSWSLDAPLTVDGLLDLPGATYRALYEAASPWLLKLLPASFTPDKDPESPTQPSAD